ncbi:hypothetical protein GOV05_00235 [Candidatus Woesearchaeota archaeon]|nr:hypothetical protein [Candidatus Woesearchaeota archaeon]
MVDYKLVKYCRTCKTRFVVPKSEAKKNYCDACQKRFEEKIKKNNEEAPKIISE